MECADSKASMDNINRNRVSAVGTEKVLLFTHHYPARCFGMNMPKSRDIQAKIPLPQTIWNFGYVTENGVNSNEKVSK